MIYFKQASDPKSSAVFDLRDRGLLLGDGVFDTALVHGGRIVFRQRHAARLQRDALAFELSWPAQALQTIYDKVAESGRSGALRVTLTRGPQARGIGQASTVKPTILATLSNFDETLQGRPIKLHTSEVRRNQTSPLSYHKTLAYTEPLFANRQARQKGFDDAVFLNLNAHITCTSMGNIFALFGRRLVTPPIEDGVLPGIVRGWLIEHAAQFGYEAAVTSLDAATLQQADHVFMTNSLRLMCPIVLIDQQVYPADLPQDLWQGLQKAIRAQHE